MKLPPFETITWSMGEEELTVAGLTSALSPGGKMLSEITGARSPVAGGTVTKCAQDAMSKATRTTVHESQNRFET
jgi:hypothetical protein